MGDGRNVDYFHLSYNSKVVKLQALKDNLSKEVLQAN